MQDPFRELMHEHRVIEQVLEALSRGARQDLPRRFYEEALHFISAYTDAYHHAKEEERLFTYLEQRGLPRDLGPVGVMVDEHDTGRRHVQVMRAHLARGDLLLVREEALVYAGLMRAHIAKEDQVLFPMGRALLKPTELEEIRRGFASVPIPAPSLAAYEELALRLLGQVARTA